jgi:hypothetical protein
MSRRGGLVTHWILEGMSSTVTQRANVGRLEGVGKPSGLEGGSWKKGRARV